MKSHLFLLSASFLLSSAVSAGEVGKPVPPPQKATAAQLIEDAKRALALIAKTVKDSNDKSLDPKNIRQQPFWTALKRTDEVVARIDAQLKAHEIAVFDTIGTSTPVATGVKATLPRSGIKNAKIESGVMALCNALTLLRKNYGVQALRRKRGGELSNQEQAEFMRLKDAEKTLVTQLETLKSDVKGNAHLTAELTRLIDQLKRSIDAPYSVDALESALELVDVIEGEWEGYSYYVDPKSRKAWQNNGVSESLKTIGAINKETKQDVAAADWNSLDESVEFSGTTEVSVEIEVNEVDGYMLFLSESIDGVDVEMYYDEATLDNMLDGVIEELPTDENDGNPK